MYISGVYNIAIQLSSSGSKMGDGPVTYTHCADYQVFVGEQCVESGKLPLIHTSHDASICDLSEVAIEDQDRLNQVLIAALRTLKR